MFEIADPNGIVALARQEQSITSGLRRAVVIGSLAALIAVGAIAYALVRAPEETTAIAVPGLLASGGEGGGLRLCNRTGSRVGVAIGYKENADWTTEGWWNIASGSCETVVVGALVSRFYYVYAVDYDQGGAWGGQAVMCTEDREFTIRGIHDCVTRGYETAGFFEVDTGEQRSWTVQLTEVGQAETGIGG